MQQSLFILVTISLPFLVALTLEDPRSPECRNNPEASRITLPQLLWSIYQERPYETLLMVQQIIPDDPLAEVLQLLEEVPKMILLSANNGSRFEFIRKFNAEILVFLLTLGDSIEDLLFTAAETLNYMRQTRILVLALNVTLDQRLNFQEKLLNLCRQYKITNVLLNFADKCWSPSLEFHQLKPYPHYHWEVVDKVYQLDVYYPQHWRNMLNSTVLTFTDTTMTLSYPFDDGHGGLRLNGFLARLVLLFGEHFNAHLQLYKSLQVAAQTHLSSVNQLVERGLIDIPMTIISGNDGKWLYRSYPYVLPCGVVMVPCAQMISIQEVFTVLLDLHFFGILVICLLLFSIAHSLIDYFFDGLWQPLNFVLSDRILPGILGQSFEARESPWAGLKLVYLLLFVLGLNVSAQFMANIQTLFTSPPYQRQIKTFEDLRRSPLKILLLRGDAQEIGEFVQPIEDSMLLTDDVFEYESNRNKFNISTGYFLISMSWEILNRKQKQWSRKVFCTYDSLRLFPTSPYGLQLQPHSPYKEPLDYLINLVHDFGLSQAWYSSTFSDMLRTKKISLRYPITEKAVHSLVVDDFYWIWFVVIIGLAVSCVAFVLELCLYHGGCRMCAKDRINWNVEI